MEMDASPTQKSSRNHSTDTLRTRRSSHRSHSRGQDRGERERKDRRRSSRSRDRDRDRERDRDKERDRDSDRSYRDRERRHRHHHERDRDRERDRDYDRHHHHHRDDRRRKREDDYDEDYEERAKRRRDRSPSDRYSRTPREDGGRPPRYANGDGDREARRPSRPSPRRGTPPTDAQRPPTEENFNPDEPKEDDSEQRSVFVSQLAARLTARDLGYFFEDKLGEGSVMDSRIVTDRLSRRSKGIGYVEFRTVEFVEKALNLSGTMVMGLPIMVQLTESERNKLHAGDIIPNSTSGSTGRGSGPHHTSMQLYVGSLHFNLTESDIRQVFEPFGELDFVDLHRDSATGRSKGYAFVQYKRVEDAKMALEQMEGFELAGRTLRVNTVHERGSIKYTQTESLDDVGGNLNAASRQALMQKLARTEQANKEPETQSRPNFQQAMQSRSVLLKNMFDPAEETEPEWDKELAEDVKSECQSKYGAVSHVKVEKDTQGEVYLKFDAIESAKNAVQGLNGRWFGGKQVTAHFISDAIMAAHQ